MRFDKRTALIGWRALLSGQGGLDPGQLTRRIAQLTGGNGQEMENERT